MKIILSGLGDTESVQLENENNYINLVLPLGTSYAKISVDELLAAAMTFEGMKSRDEYRKQEKEKNKHCCSN